ncbi:methionyl-tRNA synthetase [Candidatus Blochmanniella floridana]|uniref:Methionine--tRNA ligase n=1 Tax=Blochmanniella floridana TaxID=203907 RepID=SYM_BLOFL|nr:RecName: Full=Methionine--tRNA ligase; AltName: Full=Methionyl-tRNA synthetase; Short=MetRS [Candidatus Blochmannia floridanus]CAD83160.1 methionyl-tRNA synthetase [Candidatus Blochmannia floridanus]
MPNKKILVTCALPYANGPLHIGHMLEHIQADIWVRYQRMKNNEVYFICADDAHGTAIMLKSKQLNINPEIMIAKIQQEHYQDCCDFNISYNNYHSTHSEENYELLNSIYTKLKKSGFIKSRFISQLYDAQNNIFLPDRFIIGTCPKCRAHNQNGDNCDQCGAIYTPLDLINPKSAISGKSPIIKKSKHLFFDLPQFTKSLYTWIHSGVLQEETLHKVKEWFKLGLKEWDISRNEPYFGFKIPNTSSKYFYVWMDAPIGYMGTFKNLCKKNKNILFEDFWSINSKVELYHFIGKDITYFHSLFWPAILESCQYRKPTGIFVHGHVTLNGSKISKSKNNFINVRTYLSHLNSDYLRYYYATKLSSKINDIDLNFNDFMLKVNADIINKILNLASRNSNFITQYNYGYLSNSLENSNLYDFFIDAQYLIGKLFQQREFSEAMRKIMQLADKANQYIDKQAPWHIVKQHGIHNKNIALCIFSMGIQLFRVLVIYLKPVLPILSQYSEKFLNTRLSWNNINIPLTNHKINKFDIIFHRINTNQISSIINK